MAIVHVIVRIGEKFGCTREYVRQIAGDIKAKRFDFNIISEKMTEIESLRNDGKTLEEISKLLDIEFKILRRFSHPRRRVPIKHGTIGAYQSRNCRCALCRAANSKRTMDRQVALHAMGLCVTCKKPSSIWRCKDCNRSMAKYKKIEKNPHSEAKPSGEGK